MTNVENEINLKRRPSEASRCRRYLAAKPEAHLSYPFGPNAAVYKLRSKLFAIYSETYNDNPALNLKCDPDQALALRDIFDAVIPGYHMNKKHWNTVILDGSVPEQELDRMIDHSYALVALGLKKRDRQALIAKYGPELLKP